MPALLQLLRRVLGGLLLLVVVVLAAALLVPKALGYERYVLVSGSMTGTYDTGSVVFAREVPVQDLQVGDVITYAPPPGASPHELVTHRIAADGVNQAGARTFRTKGDANQSIDPWEFSLDEAQQARVDFGVPKLGYFLTAIGSPENRRWLIGLPAVLIALLSVGRLLRDAKREAEDEAGAEQAFTAEVERRRRRLEELVGAPATAGVA